MSDIIRLLPDSIANQIAAGEVIQRPASVVKELMENAIDAGASSIQLILRDSGKTLIQIIDDGKGMTETDARMAFERHATSKIRSAEELSFIKTMGFRGEALASVAAIAHVDLITRHADRELGTKISIKGSKLEKQEAISHPVGSNFSIRNLFFNVPARRKFLKSDPVELKHILEEFHRIALAHPEKFFSLHHNDNELYHLPKSKLRQRIVSVFGKSYNDKLIPVSEFTDIINIDGYIAKPEFCKKSRNEQYIFVNRRYIKSHYLNHAIRTAYEELIQKDMHPFFVLFFEIDPASIDINVHPTKQEIKFEEGRLIYNYLRVSVKRAIGQYSLTPQLDFDNTDVIARSADFKTKSDNNSGTSTFAPQSNTKAKVDNWESVYENLIQQNSQSSSTNAITLNSRANHQDTGEDVLFSKANSQKAPYQLHNSYVISQIKSGMMIIDQQAASERIMYEELLQSVKKSHRLVQKLLFPITLQLTTEESILLEGILENVKEMGFELESFGNNSFIVHGTPSIISETIDVESLLKELIIQYGQDRTLNLGVEESIAKSLARSAAIKRGTRLDQEEMQKLIDLLFACEIPTLALNGSKCFITRDLDTIQKLF